MRGLVALVGVVVLVSVGCSSHPVLPTTTNYANAALTYAGAWSAGGFGVALAPHGAATVWISNTATLRMKAYGNGQSFRVTVGVGVGAKATIGKLKLCSCLSEVTLASALSGGTNIVTVANLSPKLPLLIQAWTIDGGGTFVRSAAGDTSVKGTVTPDKPLSFYVQGASQVMIDYIPTGAVLDIHLDDRPTGFHPTTRSASGSGSGETISRTVIAWGLPGGLEKVTIGVVSGSLQLQDVAMFQAPRKGIPKLVPNDVAQRAQLLAVFGDGVAEGQTTLGFLKDSDGFADRLIALRGWRLVDLSPASASASCFGVRNVQKVVIAHPDRVIVAFGADDMIPGPDVEGCDPTIKDFGAAINSILSQLQKGLPGMPIYVQAILPTTKIPESTRTLWNAVLQEAAQAHGIAFADPSSKLNPVTDYAGLLYPNDLGHQKIADFWNTLLPAS